VDDTRDRQSGLRLGDDLGENRLQHRGLAGLIRSEGMLTLNGEKPLTSA